MDKRSAAVAAQMLAEARADVMQADQKASILFAALGVAYGAIYAAYISSGWTWTETSLAGQVVWWVGVLSAVASVSAAAFAIWPRYTAKDKSEGVTYWAHAASFGSWQSLARTLKKQDPEDVDRTVHQLWRLSRVVRSKYRGVRLAIVLGGAAGILFTSATTFLVF